MDPGSGFLWRRIQLLSDSIYQLESRFAVPDSHDAAVSRSAGIQKASQLGPVDSACFLRRDVRLLHDNGGVF